MFDLQTWWDSGLGYNTYAEYRISTGAVEVYVRRNRANPLVLEVANIRTIDGFGAARSLYRTFCKDKPALAENIHNPELDNLLKRWGWTGEYVDDGVMTRVNSAFMERYPNWAEASRPMVCILKDMS